MKSLDLKAKFAIVAGTMILAVAVIITAFLTKQQERTIREELLARALALTENLAYNCQLPLAAENRTSLGRLAEGMLKQDETSYVEFQSTSGEDLVRVNRDSLAHHGIVDVRDVVEHGAGTRSAWVRTADGRTFVDVRTTVVVAGDEDESDILSTRRHTEDVELGRVRVGLTTQPAQARIEHVRQLAGLLGLAIAVAGSILAAGLIHVLTRPMAQLMEGNRRVARGDFSLRLEVRSGDEFGRLAGSYNQMADEIQRSRELADSYLSSLRANAEHLEEANRALQQSNADLAKASRMKSEFLAVMSHELRTPLNVIIGFSEVLLDQQFGPLNEKQVRYADNVVSSGRHLLSLINDILDLSKVEAGRMQVAPSAFDLRQTLDEIHSLVRNLGTRKGLQVRLGDAPPVTPVTDPKIFRQVMLNLLSNAIKFTPTGGQVEFSVRCLDGRALRSDAAASSLSPPRRLAIAPRQMLLVEVRDTGVGIAPEDHDKLFQAFQQVDASYARRQEGTGLGLALSRKLVTLLGGEIWFESAPGEGSTFWFYVPFEWVETGDPVLLEQAPLADKPEVTGARELQNAMRMAAAAPLITELAEPETEAESTFDSAAARASDAPEPAAASAEWPWGSSAAAAQDEPPARRPQRPPARPIAKPAVQEPQPVGTGGSGSRRAARPRTRRSPAPDVFGGDT